MELTLLERIPQGRDRKFQGALEKKLQELSSGLVVNLKVMGLSRGGMPRLQVSGEDEEAFLEILRRSFGLAPKNTQDLLDQPIRKGFIQRILEQENVLLIDIGLEDQSLRAVLGAESLRAQLFDGVHIPLRSMVTRCGLLRDFPLEVRVLSCNGSGSIEVELSDRERDLLNEWRCLPFDRIIIQNSLESEIIEAVRRAGLERDIAGLENLSFTTHSLVCKLGTDGQGLVRRLGSQLEAVRLFVFHPDSCRNGVAGTEHNSATIRSPK